MKLFIDANIYLDFYNSNAVEYKTLLETLTEAKPDLIITQQIVDEVIRNRSGRFKESFNNYTKTSGVIDCKLPTHIGSNVDTKLVEWNKERAKLAKDLKTSNESLLAIRSKYLEDVHEGKDNVSKTFNVIFKDGLEPSLEQINRARWRKEIGNPPGKRSDVLGDQLSWEQLIDCLSLSNIKRLALVTRDSDYFVDLGKDKPALNPLLSQEIKKKHPTLKVDVFTQLGPALDYYNSKKSTKLKTLPNKEKLKQIEREEQIISGSTTSNFEGNIIVDHVYPIASNPLMELIMTNFCANCGESTLHRDVLITINGGQRRRHMCAECGSVK